MDFQITPCDERESDFSPWSPVYPPLVKSDVTSMVDRKSSSDSHNWRRWRHWQGMPSRCSAGGLWKRPSFPLLWRSLLCSAGRPCTPGHRPLTSGAELSPRPWAWHRPRLPHPPRHLPSILQMYLAVCHSQSGHFEWPHKAKSRVQNRVRPSWREPVLLWTDPWVPPPSGWQQHSEWVHGIGQKLFDLADAPSPGQWVQKQTPVPGLQSIQQCRTVQQRLVSHNGIEWGNLRHYCMSQS